MRLKKLTVWNICLPNGSPEITRLAAAEPIGTYSQEDKQNKFSLGKEIPCRGFSIFPGFFCGPIYISAKNLLSQT